MTDYDFLQDDDTTAGFMGIHNFVHQLPANSNIQFNAFEFNEDKKRDCFYLTVYYGGMLSPRIRIETEWFRNYLKSRRSKQALERYPRKELKNRLKAIA